MGAGSGASSETTLTRDVLERYRSGAKEAEQRLFSSHRERLLERVQRHPWMHGLRAHTTNEDVVAEVFLRALAGGFFERFDDRGRGSLERALATILERVLADGYRRLGARKRVDLVVARDERGAGAAEAQSSASDSTPTSSARAKEILALCRRTLEDEEWRVWRAAEVLGHGSDEIARGLGKSASAARSILHRARLKLLRAIAEHEE